MTYRILNTRTLDQILYTLVEYTFENDVVEVEVAHFEPQSKEDIISGITNRAASEQRKLEASKVVETLKSELDKDI